MEPAKRTTVATPKKRLGELLMEKGMLTPPQLADALDFQTKTGEYLGAVLVRRGIITEPQLMEVLAEQLGMPCAHLAEITVAPELLAKVPPTVATRYLLMPIAMSNNTLHVAIADPFDVQTLDELRLLLKCQITPVLAGSREIREAIQRHYGLGASAVEQLLDTGARVVSPTTATEDLTESVGNASIMSFVNQVLLQGVKDRATDIHIEPYETYMRIRERVDGMLYAMPIPPDLVKLHQEVVSRIKVMAKLDIAERRLPQDGRIKIRIDGQELDLRVSVLPTSFGEGVDIRILSSWMLFSLEQLGLGEDHLRILSELLARPHGILFVTGPTGSGKTTTLYTCLSKLNVEDRKIITIEDPIEYQLSGISQIQVHPKIGLSFAAGLRSMLRHDPDIMMVGEVRDPETAGITIRSALTGHLVFSTLHTNDAASGVTRLLDMELEPYLVASSVLCFIAQRLVRLVCPDCREPIAPAPELRQQFGVTDLPGQLMRGRGCLACKGTGFKGRTAIYEFLVVDESIQSLILRKATSHDIALAAVRQGMRTLRQDGWSKVLHGLTTPEEVLRVS
jgi:type II secretion system protein E